jgi:DNA-binding transcriptional LysR family regulator
MTNAADLFAGVVPFYHAAQERSFRRAAERLGVTPAAVSKAVLKLEDSLGVKLLARTSRTVSLTPEGAVFLERCRDAIASLSSGREQLTAARKLPRGEVHLTLPFILAQLVVPHLAGLSARYPELSFRLTLTDRLLPLVEDNIDAAVRIGAPADSSLVSHRLRGSRWVTVASPAFVGRRGSPAHPRELAGYNCLRFVAPNGRPRDYTFRDPRTGQSAPLAVSGNLLVNHGEHLLAAAASGLGIAQVLDFMVDEPLRDGRLVEVLAAFAAEGPPIHALIVPERRRAPNVAALLAFLEEVLGEPRIRRA